jgi:hypothetical protein
MQNRNSYATKEMRAEKWLTVDTLRRTLLPSDGAVFGLSQSTKPHHPEKASLPSSIHKKYFNCQTTKSKQQKERAGLLSFIREAGPLQQFS